ncbi:STAS domain-containing protein [Streptosporangiaceae bacterium NEAU-GS5]|nr:STAS domain-containing protein [Streptosporangiaceae bacterium NEAU-GS5]
MMGTPFTVTVDRRDADLAVITVAGELDALSAPALTSTIAAEIHDGRIRLILDAARIQFCDSQGLWVLIQAMRKTAAAGGSFRLAAPAPGLRRLLTVTHVADAFPIDTDVVASLDAESRPPEQP